MSIWAPASWILSNLAYWLWDVDFFSCSVTASQGNKQLIIIVL